MKLGEIRNLGKYRNSKNLPTWPPCKKGLNAHYQQKS